MYNRKILACVRLTLVKPVCCRREPGLSLNRGSSSTLTNAKTRLKRKSFSLRTVFWRGLNTSNPPTGSGPKSSPPFPSSLPWYACRIGVYPIHFYCLHHVMYLAHILSCQRRPIVHLYMCYIYIYMFLNVCNIITSEASLLVIQMECPVSIILY